MYPAFYENSRLTDQQRNAKSNVQVSNRSMCLCSPANNASFLVDLCSASDFSRAAAAATRSRAQHLQLH